MNQQDVVKMKRKNKKKAKKIIMLIFLVLIALGLLFTLSVTVFFPVKSVEIEGNSYYTSEEIKKAVDINKKDNLLIINEEKVLNDLQKQLPFVDDIKINKKLPGAVKITVTEAKEKYCYKIGDTYYSADKNNRVLGEYNDKPRELIFVEINAEIVGEQIKTVQMPNKNTYEIFKTLQTAMDSFSYKVDYIDISNLQDIKIGVEERFTIEIGSSVYIEDKINLLREMLKTKGENDSGTFVLDKWSPENPTASYFKSAS